MNNSWVDQDRLNWSYCHRSGKRCMGMGVGVGMATRSVSQSHSHKARKCNKCLQKGKLIN